MLSLATGNAVAGKESACTDDADCAAGWYCSFPFNTCGGTGTCEQVPDNCLTVYDPVCGCDAATYSNECVAAMNGASIDFVGACEDGDDDDDGYGNERDNCRLVANASQCDSDGDGFGNHCDADLDNDGVVNTFDLGIFRARLGNISEDVYDIADLDCNGVVNSFDLTRMRQQFGGAPGPGA